MKSLPKNKVVLLTAMLGIFLLIGVGCKGGAKSVSSLPQVTLNYWTVWNEPDDFTTLITAYRTAHPNVTINVRKFAYADYEKALVEGWARDEGPDIFSIPNAAIGKYTQYMTPLPTTLKLPALVTKKSGCTKSVQVADQSKNTIKPGDLDSVFVPAVATDVLFDNQIYGLPLATDTLTLLYNKDLLNAAKIVAPPRTWQELVNMVDASKTTLTREENSEIVQAGVALGTADNITRSPDILATLMMQSGVHMTDASRTNITFQAPATTAGDVSSGVAAVNFYTSFANPTRVSYSWNDKQQNAQEAFAAGKVAFFIGYKYQLDAIRQQNPSLNVGIAPLPQINLDDPQVNYANYWVESVAKRSKNPADAWNFILFATTGKTASGYNVAAYLNKTKKPAALRDLVTTQKEELDLRYFVDSLTIARSWYHGYDYLTMENAMRELIRTVDAGGAADQALSMAADKIQITMSKPQK